MLKYSYFLFVHDTVHNLFVPKLILKRTIVLHFVCCYSTVYSFYITIDQIIIRVIYKDHKYI